MTQFLIIAVATAPLWGLVATVAIQIAYELLSSDI